MRRTDRCLATLDHSTPTVPVTTLRDLEVVSEPSAAKQVRQMERNCKDFGIELRGFGSRDRGIVHVMGPELGATHPGSTIVCGDSHTSTHGAFGALAFGIGTTEVGHVLATQCLLQRKPKTLAINIDGNLPSDVTAKDLILKVIGTIGVGGGTGHVLEYRGTAVSALSMEERMTVCNMSIEAGARAGMVAPDDTTYQYMAGRPLAPQGAAWDAALKRWRALPTDAGAKFDKEVTSTSPSCGRWSRSAPIPAWSSRSTTRCPKATIRRFAKPSPTCRSRPASRSSVQPVDVVFIGSCTNRPLERHPRRRQASCEGRTWRNACALLVVPGSADVKRQAEAEGLDEVVRAAGGEWREPGCSMCIGMNGDTVPSGKLSVSTSNRNFEGRQGSGARTVLASPLTAAATAVKGVITDPREL